MPLRLATLSLLASLTACATEPAPGPGVFVRSMGGASGMGRASATAGTAGEPAQRPPDISGEWLVMGFGDPLSLKLSLTGSVSDRFVLKGPGCFDGPSYRSDCQPSVMGACSQVGGVATGRNIKLSVDFHATEDLTYAVDAFASEKAERFAGAFSVGPLGAPVLWSEAVLWMPLQNVGFIDCASAFTPVPTAAVLATLQLEGYYQLQGDVALGWLEPGTPYLARAGRGLGGYAISGRLGAFWSADLVWDEASATLNAGPVPETVPGMPTHLAIQVGPGDTVPMIIATIADGTSGTLLPVPEPEP